jgi:hypothetical protein
MSSLGKILLYVALVGALAAVGAGVMLVLQYNDTKTNLTQTQAKVSVAETAEKKAKAETEAITQAKADSDKQLADATSKVTDLQTQLAAEQKVANDATTAVQTANDAAKAAQDKLDAINKTLKGASPDDLVNNAKKAQDDLAAAQAEQKIIQDQLQASQTQIATLEDAINRSNKGGTMPGISGKVTFVDHAWNFVILDVGISNGVVPNGELIVYRGRDFLGKVRVTKVDPNDAVAEILPDVKGDIQIGDSVLN